MDKFIKLPDQEKKNIIQKSSFDLGLRFDVVEKDIWVCWVLDKLFSLKELDGNLVFKGGTCLSKAYNLIARFSEDIDITINKDCLEILNNSKKLKNVKSHTKKAAKDFVKNKIYKILNKVCREELKDDDWSLEVSEDDNSTLLFNFPSISSNLPLTLPFTLSDNYNYIKPNIKIEFGALGSIEPTEKKLVQPYAKKILPNLFETTEVKVLDIKRNFLEKILILHSICYRPKIKKLRPHYSRHYYDVVTLIKSGIGKEAINFPDILKSVVENKIMFWNESWEPYNMIKSFSDIKLIPKDESRIKELEMDYKNMEEMFFSDFPTFTEILLELKNYQNYINKT